MLSEGLTLPPPRGRGCGSRKKSKLYACCGVSPKGTPVWKLVLDPPVPYIGEQFRGVVPGAPELVDAWPEDFYVLMDWVGTADYPSVPSFVEELRRYGLSRQISVKANYSDMAGKDVYLALIHERAIPVWDNLPDVTMYYCKYKLASPEVLDAHYDLCIYHLWPDAIRYHEQLDTLGLLLAMPWGQFDPCVYVHDVGLDPQWPKPDSYRPGVFMLVQITHFEGVEFVDTDVQTQVTRSGLPVVIVEE